MRSVLGNNMKQLSKACLAGLFLLAACKGGNGNGEDKVRGTQLVAGANLVVEDVSKDGSTIAYTDGNGKTFIVPVAGGDPVEVGSGADKVAFKGDILVLFFNINAAGEAVSMDFVPAGDTTAQTSAISDIKVSSVRASEDSQHLFFEDANSTAFLDDTAVVTGNAQIRGRFTADNQFLIVSSNPAAVGGIVQSFPLNGGGAINLPCGVGCSGRFDVANTGNDVVFGANEAGDVADLTVIGANGQGASVLAQQNSDNGFKIASDSDTLVFMNAANSVSSIGLNGAGLSDIGVNGSVDLEIFEANSKAIAYAIALPDANGNFSIRIAKADGSQDTALGNAAADEGFSTDGSFYMFRDGVSGGVGSLKFTSTADIAAEEVAAAVDKASFQDGANAVFLDTDGLLQTVDLTKNKPAVYEDFVGKFELIRAANGDANKVAFSVPAGAAAGLYVDAL